VDVLGLVDFSTLQNTLLDYLVDYTYPVLAVTVFFGAVGVPMPNSLVILTAGALAGQGNASLYAVVLVTGLFASIGDSISYVLGSAVMRRLGRVPFVSREMLYRGSAAFEKNADHAIFLSRFLFTLLGTPVNLLAAAYKVGYGRFIMLASVGELLWGLELGLIGYSVGAYVEELYQLVSNVSAVLVLGLAVLWLAKKSR
jgi:membrane-associated protein